MTKRPEIEEPEFTDTFDRPAWWHRQQWLAAQPSDALPRKAVTSQVLERGRLREGLAAAPDIVRAAPEPIRCQGRPLRTAKRSGAAAHKFTYLVAADGTHLVKVGGGRNPKQRLRELQTGQPMDLFLMWSVPGDYEHALHARFAQYRFRGEWFDLRELGDPVTVVTDAINEIKAAEPGA